MKGISFLIISKDENGSFVPVSSPVTISDKETYFVVATALRSNGFEIVLLPNLDNK